MKWSNSSKLIKYKLYQICRYFIFTKSSSHVWLFITLLKQRLSHPDYLFIQLLPLAYSRVFRAWHADVKKAHDPVIGLKSEKLLCFLEVSNATCTEVAAESISRGGEVHVLHRTKNRAQFLHLWHGAIGVAFHPDHDNMRRLRGLRE